MRNLLTILLLFFASHSFAQTANAGSDVRMYLDSTNTATLNGNASTGTSFLWTETSTDYMSGAIITSPTSKVTTVTGLPQGVFYFKLKATTGGTSTYDSMKVIVDYTHPPKNSNIALYLPMSTPSFASFINNRSDTTNYNTYVSGKEAFWQYAMPDGINYMWTERDRSNGMMVDSMRGKFYNIVEDGYGGSVFSGTGKHYARSQITFSHPEFIIDSNKTYIVELKMYYPQNVKTNWAVGAPTWSAVGMFGIHENDNSTGTGEIGLRKDSIEFFENSTSTDLQLIPTDSIFNRAHTVRLTLRQGKGYTGQKAFVRVTVDGVQKYFRNSGDEGRTWQQAYFKLTGLYDYRNWLVDPDSTTRNKKFALATEAMNVWVINNTPTVDAGIDQSINTSSTTLSGTANDDGVSGNGTITSYVWAQVSGGSYTISSPYTATTSVSGLSVGTHVFQLTAVDNSSISGNDQVTIVVSGTPQNLQIKTSPIKKIYINH